MPHYLIEYELDSDLTLSRGTAVVDITPKSQLFRASISELASKGDEATLAIRIFVDADSISDAEEKGKHASEELVQGLAIATSGRFEKPMLTRIIDWTPGIELRQAAVFLQAGRMSNPHPALDQAIGDGISEILHGELQPHVRNALGWYRDGLLGKDPDKKVQAFWLSLETLVGGMKWQEKVADQCKRCKAELYCQTCKRISKHKPFPAQKVRLLLRDATGDDDALFNEVVEARHTLMHGGTLIGPKDGNPYPYSDMIERLARASRRCVFTEMMSGAMHAQHVTMLEPSTYLHRVYRIKSDCFIEVPLRDGRLLPENIPETTVELSRENGGFVLRQKAIGTGRVDLGHVATSESRGGE